MALRVPRDLKYRRKRKLHVLMKIIKFYVKGLETVRVELWAMRLKFIVICVGKEKTCD